MQAGAGRWGRGQHPRGGDKTRQRNERLGAAESAARLQVVWREARPRALRGEMEHDRRVDPALVVRAEPHRAVARLREPRATRARAVILHGDSVRFREQIRVPEAQHVPARMQERARKGSRGQARVGRIRAAQHVQAFKKDRWYNLARNASLCRASKPSAEEAERRLAAHPSSCTAVDWKS